MDARVHTEPLEHSGNLLAAGRRLLATVWEHAGIRLELFSLELSEERSRLIGSMVAIVALVVFIGIALAFAGIGILLAAWESPYRVAVAAGIAATFAVGAGVAWLVLRHLIDQATPLFRHSLAEWRRDVDDLRPRPEAES